MSADRATYVDSSAIVRLVVREPQSAALRRYLRRRRPLVSSALARTEVLRAVLPTGIAAQHRATQVLGRLELIRLNNRVLDAAGELEPAEVRSLDAIHLATAALLGDTLHRIITYDERMADAATGLGFDVHAPA
jgi:predicted nucleic acid-binding protein